MPSWSFRQVVSWNPSEKYNEGFPITNVGNDGDGMGLFFGNEKLRKGF